MWHEARKNEKNVRKLLVDYRKRSARRQEFYEKIKQDPTKFLQVHGRKLKVHIDGVVAKSAETNNHMMPWQGNKDNMIDRFDVRTHMDFIGEVKSEPKSKVDDEEGLCNFERYRVLIYNDYKKMPEAQHLRQIYINEQYPEVSLKEKHEKEIKKQKLALSKAQIGFDYGSSSQQKTASQNDSDSDSEDEEDILQELEEIPTISELSMDTLAALDSVGHKKYSLKSVGFSDGALRDQAIIDKADKEMQLENEKLQLTGRKGRRERRILKDERLRNRDIGPLSYVSTAKEEKSESSSSSSSESESDSDDEKQNENKKEGKIEFITSFDIDASKTSKRDSSPDTFNPETSVEQSKNTKKGNKHKSKTKRRRRSSSSSSSDRGSSRRHHRSRRSSSREYRYRRSRSRSYERSSSRHRRRRSRSSSREYRRYRRRSSSRSRSRSSSRGRRSNSRERNYSRSKLSATAVISSTKTSLATPATKSKNKPNSLKTLTPQEKLKIKMQRALNKQFKKDRAVQNEKTKQAQEEQMAREDDLREMSRKMRKRRVDDEDDY